MHKIVKRELKVLTRYAHRGSIGIPVKINTAGNRTINTIAEAKETIGILEPICEKYRESWLQVSEESQARPKVVLDRPKNIEAPTACRKRWTFAHQVLRCLGEGFFNESSSPT